MSDFYLLGPSQFGPYHLTHGLADPTGAAGEYFLIGKEELAKLHLAIPSAV